MIDRSKAFIYEPFAKWLERILLRKQVFTNLLYRETHYGLSGCEGIS